MNGNFGIILPYFTFIAGSIATIPLGIHQREELLKIFVASIFVSSIVVSILIMQTESTFEQISGTVTLANGTSEFLKETVTKFGFQSHVVKFILFCGVTGIYGTSVLMLLDHLRKKYSTPPGAPTA